MNTNSVRAITEPLRALYERQNRPTVKLAQALPCNQYYNVVLANAEGAWAGQVVSHLTLEDWCLLHGYRLWVSGTHMYCDATDGKTKTILHCMEYPTAD